MTRLRNQSEVVVDMLCRGDIIPVPYEQKDDFIASKITPTSSLFRRTDSIVYRLPAVILGGNFRGLEVMHYTSPGEFIIDNLDGTI